jgi:hypothetical protein
MVTLELEKIDNEYDLNQFAIQQIQRCQDLNDHYLGLIILAAVRVIQGYSDWEKKLFCAQLIKNSLDHAEKEVA